MRKHYYAALTVNGKHTVDLLFHAEIHRFGSKAERDKWCERRDKIPITSTMARRCLRHDYAGRIINFFDHPNEQTMQRVYDLHELTERE